MDHTDLYINGAWVQTDTRSDVINPATETVLASVASAEIERANAALDAAQAAMDDWAKRTPRERSEVLRNAWELMTALAFHVMALARCLREFPRFDASLSADGDTLILKDYVHIDIAVDTPHALMVPLDLSYDHRVTNGADAAGFIPRYDRLIAEPRHLLL